MVKNIAKSKGKKKTAAKPVVIDNTQKITSLLKEYRLMYVKLKNGDELVSWIAPFGTGAQLKRLDIEQSNSNNAGPQMKTELEKEELLISLEQEIKDRTELFLTKGNHAEQNLVELKYPTKLTYSMSATRQTPVVFLTPWISTSISSSQLFPLAKNDIISMASVEPELMALYVKTVQRIILSITVSKQMEKMTEDEEGDDTDWDESANTVKKIAINQKTDANTVPYIVWNETKKTVH